MGENGASSYRRFLEGEVGALEELVRQYSDSLVRFAYGYVGNSFAAEDIAEDTFAALIFRRRHFDGESGFRAWLYKMARNKSIDYLRKHSRTVALSAAERISGGGDCEAEMFMRERDRKLFACMQSLPEQYRGVLNLAYFDGFSVSEISKIMKRSRKQVYNLLARAKSSLKEILVREGVSYENL